MDYDKMTIAELEKTLDLRQRKFIANVVSGYSYTEAAILAGYSERSAAAQASALLKKPKIAAYRRALARAVLESHGLTPESIALRLFEIYERCMQKTPVQEWDSESKSWTDSGVWQFDAKGATKVLELLGKNSGMFADRVKLDGVSAIRIETDATISESGN